MSRVDGYCQWSVDKMGDIVLYLKHRCASDFQIISLSGNEASRNLNFP